MVLKYIKEHVGFILGILVVILIGLGVVYYFFNAGDEIAEAEIDFELDTLFLKVTLAENSSAINHIKIEDGMEDLSIKVNQIPDLVDFSYSEEVTETGGNEIEITFNSNGAESGVYLGELEIESREIVKKIPIILEIQSEIVVFDSNINLYTSGKSISPGKTFNVNVRIFDLANFERSSIEVIYFVKDFKGNTVLSESEQLIIEEKLDYSKSLTLSEDTEFGNYVVAVVVKYTDSVGDQSVGTSTILFKVVEEDDDGTLSDKAILYIILMFGFFFLIFLGLFVYTLFFRDRMLKELQKQYKGELRRQMELIECKRNEDYSKLKTPEEKKQYRKEVDEIKRLRKVDLKDVKEKKIKEFREIKKKYSGGSLKQKLARWKRQGYDTNVLEKKHKMPSVKGIKAKVREWKRKGYDTSILERK